MPTLDTPPRANGRVQGGPPSTRKQKHELTARFGGAVAPPNLSVPQLPGHDEIKVAALTYQTVPQCDT